MRRRTLLLVGGLLLVFALPVAFALRSLVWLEWRVALEQPVVAGPVLAGDLVLVASADGVLHALERADGATRWRVRCAASLSAESVAVRDGSVLCAGGGRLLALDLASGAERFERMIEPRHEQLDAGSTAAVALGADAWLVAVGSTLWSVGPQGELRFAVKPWPGSSLTSLRIVDGLVLATSALRAGGEGASSGAGGVAALVASSGALRWRRDLDAPVEVAVEHAADLVFALMASNPPQIVALELESGAPRWSGPGETAPVALGESAVDALGATLRARDLTSGAPRWEKMGFEGAWSAPPARAGERLVVAFGPALFAFGQGGVQLFSYPLRGRIGPRLAGDAARVFYVENGTQLVALDVD